MTAGISVLTLVKGRHAHLTRLVEGLTRSDPPPGELVIVAMDEEPITLTPTTFPVRILTRPAATLPLAAARNLAAAAATQPNLLFLDVDCIPMQGLPATMSDLLDRHDALICPEIHYLPAGAVQPGWTQAALLSRAVTHEARRFPSDGVTTAPHPGLFWSVAFGVRAARFASLGGFDERFTGYGAEDTDLAFRADRAGLDILLAGGPGAFHQHHPVFAPPLQHFDDILRNARLFHETWGIWPMDGWLDHFATIGLIARHGDQLTLRRKPTPTEIATARQPDHIVF